ncbi:MAG: family 43 glycosylhydrolase [Spirochaetales bacterium]|nr:family 43 glycosylhydrolase [Spirochaetales bacterium]
MKRLKTFGCVFFFAAVVGFTFSCISTGESLRPGAAWYDTNGRWINAHGGGVMHHEGVYYWFGEHKIAGWAGNKAMVGVGCYSSTDLYNWKDEGIALAVTEQSGHDIEKGCILERPKVIYNPKTQKFVMWFHLELKGQGYTAARFGVAVADNPAGPYKFLYSSRANAGVWPLNITDEEKIDNSAEFADGQFSGGDDDVARKMNVIARDFEGGQMARDMNLFVDDDGSAYCVYSSEENGTLHISRLTDDFTRHSGEYVRVFPKRWHEAPAIFKKDGRYYLLSSGCTGWSPNAARSAVADSIFGPWVELGNPAQGRNPYTGMDHSLTFGGQSTCVFRVEGTDTWIAMFDIWRPENAKYGRYVWLPVTFTADGYKVIWEDEWKLK